MSCDCVRKLEEPKYWGGIVVFAAFVCSFLTLGILRSAAIFYDEWMNYFDEASSVTSILGTMTSTVGLFFGKKLQCPLANTLATRFGSRPVVMAGGIVTSIGFFATALAPNIYVLFVTYGFLIGFGFSPAISPMMVIPVYYFKERPSLAIGLAYTGTGIGGIVLPILLQYLAEAYSWRGAAIVMSAASLNICVCGAVVRPLQEHEVYDGSSEEDIDVAFLRDQGNGVTEELCLNRAEGSGGSPGVTRIKLAPQDEYATELEILLTDGKSQVPEEAANGLQDTRTIQCSHRLGVSCRYDDDVKSLKEHAITERPRTNRSLKRSFKDLFTNLPFMLANLETIFFSSALHIASEHLKSAVVGVGSLSNSEGTYALTAWGGGSLAGALGAGIALFKFPKIDALIVIIAETTICGCSLIVITLVSSEYDAVLVMCFVVGFTVDPHNYLMQLVHKSMVGLADLRLAFGVFLGFYGIGGLIGPALAGYAYDMTGDYSYSLYIAGAFDIIGNILIIKPCINSIRQGKSSG